MKEREDKIKEYRFEQGIEELNRKAEKACRWKQKIWTQEEIEAAEHQAEQWSAFFNGEAT